MWSNCTNILLTSNKPWFTSSSYPGCIVIIGLDGVHSTKIVNGIYMNRISTFQHITIYLTRNSLKKYLRNKTMWKCSKAEMPWSVTSNRKFPISLIMYVLYVCAVYADYRNELEFLISSLLDKFAFLQLSFNFRFIFSS